MALVTVAGDVMSKGLGLSVAAGLASGLIFLSVLTGESLGILLIYLTPLPLAMVGLSFGLSAAAIASGVSLVTVALVSVSAVPSFAVISMVPALVLVRQALLWRQNEDGTLEWYPPGLILAWLTGIAVGLLAAGTAFVSAQGLGIEETLRQHVAGFVTEMAPNAPVEMRDGLIALWSALMPAMAACAWLIIAVLNGVLAQATVTKAGHARRPTPPYGSLELPGWIAVALGAAVLLGLLADGDIGYVARNMAVVLLWPYVFVGLTVVHQALRGRRNAGILFAVFYTAVFALFGWALVAIAGLGLVRHWTRLRRHKAGGGQEKK
ncbi:MAG TPA: DUF2232 domain-containing protein [Patescibacteria group bacterium]|nr:DUF2232 domain-containing protein [Patescibacteria group bacterium]